MKSNQRLYLVTSSVQRIDYVNAQLEEKVWAKYKDVRPVWAMSSIEAKEKVLKFWQDQYESYAHRYDVTVRTVTEALQ